MTENLQEQFIKFNFSHYYFPFTQTMLSCTNCFPPVTVGKVGPANTVVPPFKDTYTSNQKCHLINERCPYQREMVVF